MVTLHFTRNYAESAEVAETACDSFAWNGVTYTESGDYTQTFTNAAGCDSVVTLHLTLYFAESAEFAETACDSFAWNGVTYTESGNYTQAFTNASGCDSVVTLHLLLNSTESADFSETACDRYDWNGVTYNNSGDYTLTFTASNGCDSTITLHLTVIDTALRIVPLTEDFCEEQMMELMVETEMLDYVWSTGENAPTITVTQPGIYSVEASQGGCRATAQYIVEACDFRMWLPNAISPSKSDGLNDVFCLPARAANMIDDFEISIFNRWGELVFHSTEKHFQWDGTINGKLSVNTVYNYVIRYTDAIGRPRKIIGNITVL